jgi:hypothetical protein
MSVSEWIRGSDPQASAELGADMARFEARAAARRLALAHEVLAELRRRFPVAPPHLAPRAKSSRPPATKADKVEDPAGPEVMPGHLRRYAAEVDSWRLDALAARSRRAAGSG